ncbi:hypothetical protein [Desulfobulbus oligotrophicus]|jgi:hypothetical protein|uniref:Uncharacterized protein n=1 Tax=Desulfobulbus oligotrophicus TaxID=1909699 RepID=A0A7T6ARF4_9BACT|nr:hypothetical protein [Desulfobulbus oligotrophicus]MDY0390596.1 hypothetical protein [Desulfobulbus oligotrophicus]QQG66470.1 hypothetical protein HP555_11630 [Desulfobulbus oligotrophicus]
MSTEHQSAITIENDTVIVHQETDRLEAFRLEDTVRAPAVIVFVNQKRAQLVPIPQGGQIPSKIRSLNMEGDIQIISYQEIHTFLHHSDPSAHP